MLQALLNGYCFNKFVLLIKLILNTNAPNCINNDNTYIPKYRFRKKA